MTETLTERIKIEDLPTVYDAKSTEEKMYKFWEDGEYFKANAHSNKPPFTIVIPPPNVTGVLHMGHALDETLQDILTRYHRMSGYEALWIPGTDHAGLATQNVVEKQLAKEGLTRHDLGREKFLEKTWEWTNEHKSRILDQMKNVKDPELLKAEIDNLIWSFCAEGYGEVCTVKPHCDRCPIKSKCAYIEWR